MTKKRFTTIAVLTALSGCSSLQSIPTDNPGDGLVYYMPKKDIRITVVSETAKTAVSIDTSKAYPDLDVPYVLDYQRSLIGKSELKVGISSAGLLTSTKAVNTPSLGEALKNLASGLGTVAGMAAGPVKTPQPPKPCALGTFTYVYQAAATFSETQPCVKVTITRVGTSKYAKDVKNETTPPKPKERGADGLFYRQEEAYQVDVEFDNGGKAERTSEIVLSPSLSPIRFLPVAKTLFAVATAEFAFTDGMPTKYDQEVDGELLALFKIPADVIGAYFAAIGEMFGQRKGNDDKETAALLAQTQLELAKLKFKECIDAIKNNNPLLAQQLGCGK